MGWFVPLHRQDHPCLKPNKHEREDHRLGEMWRCEVCGDLWILRVGGLVRIDDYVLIARLKARWRYRKQGYAKPRSDWAVGVLDD